MGLGKHREKGRNRKHHAHIKEILVPLLAQRFSKIELATFMVDAIANGRNFDDIYGELINWAAAHYKE
jgi:hypothetical protein